MAINRVILDGNLVSDATLYKADEPKPVLRFRLASDQMMRDPQTGEWVKVPLFIGCVLFGARALKLAPYLTKGTKVSVDGKLRYSEYMKDDEKRSSYSIYVQDLEFIGQRKHDESSSPSPEQKTPQEDDLYDHDIPF